MQIEITRDLVNRDGRYKVAGLQLSTLKTSEGLQQAVVFATSSEV